MNLSLLKRSLLGMALFTALAGPVMAQEPAPANPLALDAKAIKDAGLVLDKAALRALTDELKAPGEVKADAYSTVLVSPRVESQVLDRKARLGDVVKAGAPLVVLSSVEVAATQGALIVAEQDWQRIASLGPQAVSARRYNEAKVQRDQARAKLRAYGLSEGQIGGLLRKGSAGADGSFELRVSGPFGIGAATIAGTENNVTVRTRSGTYQSDDPQAWIESKMGWTLPLGGLRYWVLGLPSPHSEAEIELNPQGQITALEQDGWHLAYTEYMRGGAYDLPRKFEVSNDEVRLKVVVDAWSDLPPPR